MTRGGRRTRPGIPIASGPRRKRRVVNEARDQGRAAVKGGGTRVADTRKQDGTRRVGDSSPGAGRFG